MKHLAKIALPLSCLGLLLQSCAHEIYYTLTDSDRWTGAYIPRSVKVDTFEDKAPKDENINVAIAGETWRINGREGYAKGEIAGGVSKMVAKHLEHSGVFQDVYGPTESGRSDLILDGEIYDYNAMGRARMGAETAIVLGSALGKRARSCDDHGGHVRDENGRRFHRGTAKRPTARREFRPDGLV